MPNGVIKSATAADWKLQTYLLGKPPPLAHKPVFHVAESLAPSTPSPGQIRPVMNHKSISDIGPGVGLVGMTIELLSPSPKPKRIPSAIRRASNVFTRSDGASIQSGAKRGSPIVKHLRSSVLLRTQFEASAGPRSPLRSITGDQRRLTTSTPPEVAHETGLPSATLKARSLTDGAPHEEESLEYLADGFGITDIPSPSLAPNQRLCSSPLPVTQTVL